jgi:hypothetical protein
MIYSIFKKLTNTYLKLGKYINSKKKRPFFAYILSEGLYYVTIIIARYLANKEFKKLDIKAIRSYYDLYGRKDTLDKFKLSDKVLEKIIS